MKNVFVYLSLAFLLSSCAGGVNSHYTKAAPIRNAPNAKNMAHKTALTIFVPQTIAGKLPLNRIPCFDSIHHRIINPPVLSKSKVTALSKLQKLHNTPQDSAQLAREKIANEKRTINNNAKASLILSIIGWVSFFVALLFPVIGAVIFLGSVVLEIIALFIGISVLDEINKSTELNKQKRIATIGVVISAIYLTVLLAIIAIVFVIVLSFK